MLEELISQGKYSPLEVKSTMKAWGGQALTPFKR